MIACQQLSIITTRKASIMQHFDHCGKGCFLCSHYVHSSGYLGYSGYLHALKAVLIMFADTSSILVRVLKGPIIYSFSDLFHPGLQEGRHAQ